MLREEEAGRDGGRLAEMPLCRFVGLYLPPSQAEYVAMVNRDRAARGLEPVILPDED